MEAAGIGGALTFGVAVATFIIVYTVSKKLRLFNDRVEKLEQKVEALQAKVVKNCLSHTLYRRNGIAQVPLVVRRYQ